MPRIRAPFGVNCLSRRYFLLRKACSLKPPDRKLSWYRKSVPVWHFVPLEFEAKAWKSSQSVFRAEQNQATGRRKFRPLRRPLDEALARRKSREEKPLRSLSLSQDQPLRPLIRSGRVA